MAGDYSSRDDGSTFHINLAPMLDIIVSIIPMLLLSVVFVQIAAIDTPMGAGANSNTTTDKAKLYALSDQSFEIKIEGEKSNTVRVLPKEGQRDWEELLRRLTEAKTSHPTIEKLELYPAQNLSVQSIVEVMDHIQGANGRQFQAVSLGSL